MVEGVCSAIKNPSKKSAAFFFSLTIALPLLLFVLCASPLLPKIAVASAQFVLRRSLNYACWSARFYNWSWNIFIHSLSFATAIAFSHFLLKYDDKDDSKKDIALKAIFVVWLLITLALVLLHEPWADELHAWTMARKFTFSQLLHEMAYEGHFLLWFLLLAPFGKLGFPLVSLNLICWLLNAAAVFLLLKKSQFNFSAKVALLFSEVFLFWYAVVARPYDLVPLVIFLLAVNFKERRNHSFVFAFLLALLANTHMYVEGFVAALFFDYLINDCIFPWKSFSKKEKIRAVTSLLIVVVGVVIAFLQVLPAIYAKEENAMSYIKRVSVLYKLNSLLGFFSLGNIRALLLLLFIYYSVFIFRSDRRSFYIMALSIVFMFLFTYFVFYMQLPQRSILWFFPLIYLLWTSPISIGKKSSFLLLFSALLFFPKMPFVDATSEFSCIKNSASFIKTEIPKDEKIYIHKMAFAVGSMADEFLEGYDLRKLESGEKFEYFSNKNVFNFSSDFDSIVENLFSFNGNQPALIMTCWPIESSSFDHRLVKAFDSKGCEDKIYIYRFFPKN